MASGLRSPDNADVHCRRQFAQRAGPGGLCSISANSPCGSDSLVGVELADDDIGFAPTVRSDGGSELAVVQGRVDPHVTLHVASCRGSHFVMLIVWISTRSRARATDGSERRHPDGKATGRLTLRRFPF